MNPLLYQLSYAADYSLRRMKIRILGALARGQGRWKHQEHGQARQRSGPRASLKMPVGRAFKMALSPVALDCDLRFGGGDLGSRHLLRRDRVDVLGVGWSAHLGDVQTRDLDFR